ncbi:PE domain-containing protein [Prescottella defluvii]
MVDGGGWSDLAGAVDGGELYLEPGVALRCAQRCEALISELSQLRERARVLGKVEGFGHLPSGSVMQAKFEAKAVSGDYPMVQALTDHIEEVDRMRSLFEKIDARFSATENDNATKFGVIGQG